MSDLNRNPSPSDAALSRALRELARSGPQSASPELGGTLSRSFHRHHQRRRFIQTAGVCIAALTLVGGWLWLRTGIASSSPANGMTVRTNNPEQRPAVVARINPIAPVAPARQTSRMRSAPRRNASRISATRHEEASEAFVALPSFPFRPPGEEFRIIRVDMPMSSLRLLGAQVGGELVARRITADLLIGSDGTPYAFRVVS